MDDKYLEGMMLDRCWQRIVAFNEAEEMLRKQRLENYKEVFESTCAIFLQAYEDVESIYMGQDEYATTPVIWGAEFPTRYYLDENEANVFGWPVTDDLRDERFYCPDEVGPPEDFLKPEYIQHAESIFEQLVKLKDFVHANYNMHQETYGLRSLIADRTGMNYS